MSSLITSFSELFHYHRMGANYYLPQTAVENADNSVLTDTAAVVWHSTREGDSSHVSISIDDKLYGFVECVPTIEPSSLMASCSKRSELTNKKVTVQYFAVNKYQKALIKSICQRKVFFCISCVHAVARILKIANVINIPFPINQMPVTSLNYLNGVSLIKFGHLGTNISDKGSKIGDLFPQKTFGSVKPCIKPQFIELALLEATFFVFPMTAINVINILTVRSIPNVSFYLGVTCASLVAMKYFYSIRFLMKSRVSPEACLS